MCIKLYYPFSKVETLISVGLAKIFKKYLSIYKILFFFFFLVRSVLVRPDINWLEDEGGPLPESPV